MSYVKLPKGVSDYAVGYQSVNQALDNNAALFDQYNAKHSVGVYGATASGDPFLGVGRHDDPLVARTVADFKVDATGPTVVAYALLSGPLINGGAEYISDGKWKITVTTPRLIGAVATIKETSLVDRFAQCRVVSGLSEQYVIVTTWDVSTGLRDNFSFSLALWSQDVA